MIADFRKCPSTDAGREAIEARRAETRKAWLGSRGRGRVAGSLSLACLDFEALRQLGHDLGKKLHWVFPHSFSKRDKLEDIDATLRSFNERYKRLVFANALGDIRLGKLRGFSCSDEHVNQMLMRTSKNRLGQASLEVTGRPCIRKFSIGILSVFCYACGARTVDQQNGRRSISND